MIFIGVDVGLKGAIAAIDSDKKALFCCSLPVKKVLMGKAKKNNKEQFSSIIDSKELNWKLLPLVNLAKNSETIIAFEKIFMAPKASAGGVITAGTNYGIIWATLESKFQTPTVISAKTWQAVIKKYYFKSLTSEHLEDTKSTSIALATMLWGEDIIDKRHDGKADALLIAEYLRIEWSNKNESA